MKRFKIGDRVVVLDNFNTTAKGKVGTIVANRDRGHVVGFFCEGVMTNYELEDYIVRYPSLKATWWFDLRGLELANTFTNNRFR
uniref:SH3-like domain protein n=1 Tax=Siphoviridae sp. ctK0l2 TaxID=2826243 RepID=A0A8S5NJ19_9CAUD|nr:MAG TPA: SH3-like domain protein [Siphoviridae sp. ctK0l2]